MKEIKVKKLSPGAIVPKRATPQSAGLDLHACIEERILLKAGKRATVATGIAVELSDPASVGLVFGRSGLGIKQGVTLSNAVGVIDSDYRGEIRVGLINHSENDYEILPGDRIAQLVILPVFLPEPVETQELDDSQRGDDGFGSSGR